MADLVNELDASVFVLEALPNMSTQQVTERLETWVRKLRDAHPHTPIILVENLLTARDSEQNRALQKVFANLRKKGVRNLWLLPGEPQLKGRENGTVDGVHPTDLGYVRMAEYYFPLLRKVLSEERGR
jgi:lysophospholipase L1-like esterase